MTDSKKLESKIKIRGKLVPEEIISMVHEAIDTINNFVSIVVRICEKGADAGFSREEISQQIIRPIARQRGLNKDQVYYLTHRPELQEKSKKQYQELKENQNQKTRNIPSPTPALQEALPAEVQALAPASYVQEDSSKGKDKDKEIVLPDRNIPSPSPSQQMAAPETVKVEIKELSDEGFKNWKFNDLDNWSKKDLIKLVDSLYNRLYTIEDNFIGLISREEHKLHTNKTDEQINADLIKKAADCDVNIEKCFRCNKEVVPIGDNDQAAIHINFKPYYDAEIIGYDTGMIQMPGGYKGQFICDTCRHEIEPKIKTKSKPKSKTKPRGSK